jgi:hypothetical protein
MFILWLTTMGQVTPSAMGERLLEFAVRVVAQGLPCRRDEGRADRGPDRRKPTTVQNPQRFNHRIKTPQEMTNES